MLTPRWLLVTLLAMRFLTMDSFAAPPDEDDEEFRPGLVAEYRVGERAVTRIDLDVAFAWDEAAPDARLSAERFEATWRGWVLIRLEAKHRLHAFVQGEVTVELDGRRVLHGSAKQPQWISGDEFVPGFAERPLVVTFRKTEPAAQLKLFWSSDAFGLEPLPPELLFHDDTSFNPNANGVGANEENAKDKTARAHAVGVAVKQENLALIERGRQQFAAFRCGRCHVREGDAVAPAAPALQHVAAGMTAEQIVKRLAPALNSPDMTALDRRMPHFRLNEQQARHLAAFLVQQSEPVKLDEPKPLKTKPPKEGEPVVTLQRRGEVLLRSVGCLACHRFGELGNSNDQPFAGPDLTNNRQRRTPSWLLTWLSDPQRLNADHRMPVFTLTDEERQAIVEAIQPTTNAAAEWGSRNLGGANRGSTALDGNKRLKPATKFGPPSFEKANEQPVESSTDAGRKLFVEHRCAACHRATDTKLSEFARPKNDLSRPNDWSHGCLDEQWVNDHHKHPIYLRGLDRAAIKAFLSSRWDRTLSPESQFVRGTRMLEEKNCFACHPRHGGIGLGRTAKLAAAADKDLAGQAPSLVPPSLNAVGDKLLDEALSIAVRGERQPIRMPWLKVRMPKFKHSPDELATLTRYLVEHDRIPLREERRGGGEEGRSKAEQPRPTSSPPPLHISSPQTHLAGQSLTGVRGWSCIACHKIGDYEPKQVALGARGSDLKMLGKHIRPEFFFRWIASPLRVIPGVEMPQYNRPIAGVHDGDLAKQHAALWQALNDPNFQPPTNPNNVEQLWVVNPGERPRIIRDVFQLPKELSGRTVPRGWAIGFDNGHSLLFDAETSSVRQWGFGDFARQQVIGKRWSWEMAGLAILNEESPSHFVLRMKEDAKGRMILASSDGIVPMGSYEPTERGISLRHFLYFPTEKHADGSESFVAVSVDESLEAISGKQDESNRVGIKRHLTMYWLLGGDDKQELWFGRPKQFRGPGNSSIEVTDSFVQIGQKRTQWSNGKTVWKDLIPAAEPGGKLEWTQLPIQDREPEDGKRVFLNLKGDNFPPTPEGHTTILYTAEFHRPAVSAPAKPMLVTAKSAVSSVPGFNGVQLPLDSSIMPTGFCWKPDGSLVFSSLKGHVFTATDQNEDGNEDRLTLMHEGLCAPYGVLLPEELHVKERLGGNLSDGELRSAKNAVLVATKPELTLLVDLDGDGYCERQAFGISGWGFTDDYHEWTSSPVRDSQGNIFFGLASDYTNKNRPKEKSHWRGKVVRQKPDWRNAWMRSRKHDPTVFAPFGHAFRYPTGIAINDRDEVFVSDQQGVQNCFNEINYLVEGAHYGVPSTHEEDKDAPETKAAIQIPHPWTRSVNGLVFLTGKEGYPDLKGHGIGCEYNGRFLIRFSTQRVGDVMQGAVYPFSLTDDELVRGLNSTATPLGATNAIEVSGGKPAAPRQQTVPNFEGPLCCGVSPKGEIYIGSIADSGWAGGQNTGSIVKLKGNGQRPNGIREIRATRDGFDIDFFAPVDRTRATNSEHYSISGYTRVWGGAYATPDSDRHRCKVLAIELSDDGKTAKLKVDSRKSPNYVYDISCRNVADPDKPLFPAYGFFTLHKIPAE